MAGGRARSAPEQCAVQKAKKKRRRRQCNKRRLEQLNKEQPPLDVEQPTEQPAAEQQLAQQSAGEDDVPADQVRLLARARACRSVTLPLHPWSQVFAKGDRVVLLRLRKHTKLNGQTAEIDRYLSERSRWRVFVTSCPYFEGRSGFLNVRAHNLCERMPELIDCSDKDSGTEASAYARTNREYAAVFGGTDRDRLATQGRAEGLQRCGAWPSSA